MPGAKALYEAVIRAKALHGNRPKALPLQGIANRPNSHVIAPKYGSHMGDTWRAQNAVIEQRTVYLQQLHPDHKLHNTDAVGTATGFTKNQDVFFAKFPGWGVHVGGHHKEGGYAVATGDGSGLNLEANGMDPTNLDYMRMFITPNCFDTRISECCGGYTFYQTGGKGVDSGMVVVPLCTGPSGGAPVEGPCGAGTLKSQKLVVIGPKSRLGLSAFFLMEAPSATWPIPCI